MKQNGRDCTTSLVVEVDEQNNTERVYWIKNEDLTLENSSQDVQIFNLNSLVKNKRSLTEDKEVRTEEDIVDVRTQVTKQPGVKEKPLEATAKPSYMADLNKGKLGGTLFTDEKGYTYILHSTSTFKRQLKCANSNLKRKKCRARASVMLGENAQVIMSSKCPPHNHPPVDVSSLASKFARMLKKTVYSCSETPIVQLYNEECKRFPEGAQCLPRRIALQRMQRYRREFSLVLHGKDKASCPLSDDDPTIPSTELKMLAEGRIIYVDHKGFQYHQQHVTANKRQLRCTKSRLRGFNCPARASMDLKPRYSHIKMTKNRHNHPAPDMKSTLFSYSLKYRARVELNKPLKQIYDEEIMKYPNIAAVVTFDKMRQQMQRARRSSAEHGDLTVGCVFDLARDVAQDGAHRITDAGGKVDADTLSSAPEDVNGDELASGLSSEAVHEDLAINSTSADPPAVNVNSETAEDNPVPTVEVVVSTRQGASLDEMVLYQCPYCQKLFDEDEPLEQHILTSHINIIVPASTMWEEPSAPCT